MKKTAISLLCGMFTIAILTVTAFAAGNTTASQAKLIAEKQVPAGSNYLKTETDNRKYEVSFYQETKQERYELTVSMETGKILSYESSLLDHRGGKTAVLTQNAAKKKVTDEISKAEFLSAFLHTEDGFQFYEVRFRTDSYYGEYTIHPENGTILERDIRIGTLPAAEDTAGLISQEKATELALKEVPGGILTDFDLDYANNSYLYEIELYKNGQEYEITLDASTGKLLHTRSHKEAWDQDWSGTQNSSNYITVEKARKLALERVPGGVIKECKLDYEDGRAYYEGELYKDKTEYEFEIDAITGAFLKWELDYDD